ncbi:hypothetical protein D3C75_812380 [compost metagenome]
MIMWVTLNMLSATALNTFSNGSLVSFGKEDSPSPNSTEKKMIGNMSPLTIDENTLEGINERMVATRLCEPLCTCSVVFSYCEISTAVSADMSMPCPG